MALSCVHATLSGGGSGEDAMHKNALLVRYGQSKGPSHFA